MNLRDESWVVMFKGDVEPDFFFIRGGGRIFNNWEGMPNVGLLLLLLSGEEDRATGKTGDCNVPFSRQTLLAVIPRCICT